jgi:DNA-binding MarR family transcriptional regulator
MTLARVMDVAGHTHDQAVATFGLSPAEFDVLATLRKVASPYELTPTELQQAVVITSGGLTKVLHQLEARDLVARAVDAEDRRSKRVRLTRTGKTLIERAMEAVLASQGEWLTTLPARDLEQLIKLLHKALRAMESHTTPLAAVKKARG